MQMMVYPYPSAVFALVEKYMHELKLFTYVLYE